MAEAAIGKQATARTGRTSVNAPSLTDVNAAGRTGEFISISFIAY